MEELESLAEELAGWFLALRREWFRGNDEYVCRIERAREELEKLKRLPVNGHVCRDVSLEVSFMLEDAARVEESEEFVGNRGLADLEGLMCEFIAKEDDGTNEEEFHFQARGHEFDPRRVGEFIRKVHAFVEKYRVVYDAEIERSKRMRPRAFGVKGAMEPDLEDFVESAEAAVAAVLARQTHS